MTPIGPAAPVMEVQEAQPGVFVMAMPLPISMFP